MASGGSELIPDAELEATSEIDAAPEDLGSYKSDPGLRPAIFKYVGDLKRKDAFLSTIRS